MKIIFQINYLASWRQTVCIVGSVPQLGNWAEEKAVAMQCVSAETWKAEIEMDDNVPPFQYYYLIKENENIVRREWKHPHILQPEAGKTFHILDIWKDEPKQSFLYTSGFTESFFFHDTSIQSIQYHKKTILIQAICPYVKKGQELVLCGSSDALGQWDAKKGFRLSPIGNCIWQVAIDASSIPNTEQYKLVIYDGREDRIVHWEEGSNRFLVPVDGDENTVRVEVMSYRYDWMNWKTAGVAIPVFSLRSNDSYGIGEFSDLKKLIDWTVITGQKIIQLLPINDTTITYTWTDSYPYNAISIYALHPIYLGLKEHPLKNKTLNTKYRKEAKRLNELKDINYDDVISFKRQYCKDLFAESGKDVLKEKGFNTFFQQNEGWLFPYACFTYFRDQNNSADFSKWEAHKVFNKKKLESLMESDKEFRGVIEFTYFIQYLLHKQLVEVKEYAHEKGVILKGDIPIGISRNSVEAWEEPHLFNLDTQTGAPPDDFSIYGQNWGFPTYNWEEMAKDGYQWWIRRFRKMADYFDAYRIDHILGFFRIWEIPLTSVQGLLGYFSPAMPLSAEEIQSYGFLFDEERMTHPYIHDHFISKLFGEYTAEVIGEYLTPVGGSLYTLKEEYNTQEKIKGVLGDKTDDKSSHIREELYSLCNEVLFIRDKYQPEKFHPRITAQYSYSYRDLDAAQQMAFNHLYDNFYYYRHSQFWRNQAMKKLPVLISSTQMLVCGEDLGMIPESVPSVMKELKILSLEIQRMPKTPNVLFENLQHIPYMSVCTTSTHDMTPIRAWWLESKKNSQVYYNDVLHKEDIAPDDCTPEVCELIVRDHLNSPAMLVILPLQDWLSIDGNIRREDPMEERINIPAVARHYWKYRMHITLEALIGAEDVNKKIETMIGTSGRL